MLEDPSTANSAVLTASGVNSVLTTANDIALVECLGADRTVTLPTAIGNVGKRIGVKKLDAGNLVQIKTVLNQTIDDVDCTAGSHDLSTQYEWVWLVSDGANWWII